MRVIDTHVHLWDRRVSSHSWMAETDLTESCLPDDLPSAEPLEREIVLVEVASDPESALSEARWFSSLVGRDGITGFVAHLPFDEQTETRLDEYLTLPGFRGVRRLFQDDESVFSDPTTDQALDLLARAAVPFDLCVRHHELEAATALLRRHPDLTVVLDHCGKPPLTQPEMLPAWREQIEQVAALPLTHCKLSGLSGEAVGLPASEAVPLFREVVEHCLSAFGEQRCLVGSDWPISPLLDHRAAAWFELVADLADPMAEQVLSGTAERVYRRLETSSSIQT